MNAAPATEPITDLDAAIALIESGRASMDIAVQLDSGRIARADGRAGLAGLLQRLKGFRMLRALAEGGGRLSALGAAETPPVADDIKVLLDAVREAR